MNAGVSLLTEVRDLIVLRTAVHLKPRSDDVLIRYTLQWDSALEYCGADAPRLARIVNAGAMAFMRHLAGVPRKRSQSSGMQCRRCPEPIGHTYQRFIGLCAVCTWQATVVDVCSTCCIPIGENARALRTDAGTWCDRCTVAVAPTLLAKQWAANDNSMAPGRVQP
jgi:hypothetical protein